jgi:putative component of toxin-antitoxin plasmid stabilization module
MKYKIFATKMFEKEFNKLNNYEKKRVQIIKEQLKIKPFSGKPLSHTCIREKKVLGKRLYYFIVEERLVVVLACYGDKKTQKIDIAKIKRLFEQQRFISILLFFRTLYLQHFFLIVQSNRL